MADPYDDEDVYTPSSAARNDMARGFLRQYEDRAAKSAASYEDIMRQRTETIARVRGELDNTIKEMREKQSGAGAGQINLPLLALGAGLLSPEPGGRVGNFGSELSRGLTAMGATIANQRKGDADFLQRLAQLQQKSGELEDLPLRDRAQLARQEQLNNESQRARIEAAMIRADAAGGKNGVDPAIIKEWRVWQQEPGNEGKPLSAYQEFKSRLGADRNTPKDIRELDAHNKERKDKGLPPIGLEEWKRLGSAATASGRAVGEGQGKAEQALPGAELNAEQTLAAIERLEKHPGLPKSVGWSSYNPANKLPGDATNFRALKEQVLGKMFLTAYESLRGAQAITDIEGKKATDALANLDTAQDETQFRENLAIIKDVVKKGLEVSRKKAGVGAGSGSPDAPPMAGAIRLPDGGWGVEKDGKWFRVEKKK